MATIVPLYTTATIIHAMNENGFFSYERKVKGCTGMNEQKKDPNLLSSVHLLNATAEMSKIFLSFSRPNMAFIKNNI